MPDKTTIAALSVAVGANVPVIVWGPPGCGKTTTVTAMAHANGWPLEVVIASIREPSDFAGLPHVRDEGVVLAAPRWAERLADQGHGLLFLDELSTAAPSVQAALLRVPLERTVGDLALPGEVRIVAAANRQDEAAGTWDLSAPMANRFCHLPWDPSPRDIADGFIDGFPVPEIAKLPSDWEDAVTDHLANIGTFLRHRPELAVALPEDSATAGRAWPSPRSWEMAARLLAAAEAAGVDDQAIALLVTGAVGAGPSLEYLSWRRDPDLPDPEYVLEHPDELDVPQRNDRALAVLSSVVAAVANNPTAHRWGQGWKVVQRYLDVGQDDVAALGARKLARCRPDDAPANATIEALLPILEEAGLA